ncbi:MAG: hypothetical protein KGN36_01375, partial [Acidobacteriota bacterium]|nr:hypothetical protein [Acidobacteriota bacterium]
MDPTTRPVEDAPQEEFYAPLARQVRPRMEALSQCRSTAEMEAHPAWREIEASVRRALDAAHVADFRPRDAEARSRYRILAWNIERGTQFEGQLNA